MQSVNTLIRTKLRQPFSRPGFVSRPRLQTRITEGLQGPLTLVIAQLPLKLLEIHLSDNDGQDDQHHPLGMGIIQYESVARGLKRIAFDGLSTIEIDPREISSPAEARQDVVNSVSYWKNICEVTS